MSISCYYDGSQGVPALVVQYQGHHATFFSMQEKTSLDTILYSDMNLKRYSVITDPSLDIHSLTISSGENLPHWQCDNAIYHISFRLADSVPYSVREQWLREREYLIANAKEHGYELSEETKKKVQYLYSEQIEKHLDAGYGKCYLSKAEIAKLVANSFTYFDNVRYRLHAWCIMPNHVHIIVEAMPDNDLSKIIHLWKSYTAHRVNKILGLTGDFWQRDTYNHIIRSRKEYLFQIKYTWENPEKAGLQNWQWRWKNDNI